MRSRRAEQLVSRYGPNALIIGGSEGIGYAFAELLAEVGFDLTLVARRGDVLKSAAEAISDRFEVTVETEVADAAASGISELVAERMRQRGAGLLVYSAARSDVTPVGAQNPETVDAILDVNCRGLVHSVRTALDWFSERTLEEGVGGGIILMSSLAALRGSSHIAVYAASKAFIRRFGESLYTELAGKPIDVVTCLAGATDTPTMRSFYSDNSLPGGLGKPRQVARAALRGLGRRPIVVPGLGNKLAAFVVGRLLPTRTGSRLLSRYTRRFPTDDHSRHE